MSTLRHSTYLDLYGVSKGVSLLNDKHSEGIIESLYVKFSIVILLVSIFICYWFLTSITWSKFTFSVI